MSAGNYNQASLPLEASSNCRDTSATWVFSFTYTTADGSRQYTSGDVSTSTTLGQSTNWLSPSGLGGQGSITVTASVNSGALTTELLSYIEGTNNIPSTSVTNQLLNLYASGATLRLLTGIAMRESSYQQFALRTLYGTQAYWPLESYDGGSHVGLMQVPNGMNVAFDWIQNTQGGADIFQQKLTKAQGNGSSCQAGCPGLPGLTGVKLENDALVFYGPYAGSGPYYVPCNDCSGWIQNPNNSDGISYANDVRSKVQ